MNILHIDSAITGDASVSRQLTAQIVARLKAANPAASVTYRDLNEGVPAIDTDWFKAVRLVPENPTAEQQARATRIGLWSDREPVKPSEFRRGQK